jgi:mono/diheme cytochrome c family protein
MLMTVVMVLGLGSLPAAAQDLAAGQAVYKANCLACHGKRGDGKGPAAVALRPAPTDLTQASWWTGKADNDLKKIIRAGNPGTAMMGFKHITGDDMDNLVAYLRSLAPQESGAG